MQRANFIGSDALRAQDGQEAEADYIEQIVHGSDVGRQICDLQKAFTLPSRAIQLALFDNFWNYCYPWDPIVEKSLIVDVPTEKVSPLLLQAILLGGSRLSAASLPSDTAHDFYLRAKTLFYTDQERNPLTKVIAASLMHWWNPHGPEIVSTNTSTFWNRIAVSLAMQMGLNSAQRKVPDESLRRRIWWTLVARDHLISAAHGRPQAINLDHCDIPLPRIDDFPTGSTIAPVFVSYVALAVIVGRFVDSSLDKYFPAGSQQTQIGGLLSEWIHDLPRCLRPLPSALGSRVRRDDIDTFAAQQLSITFYAAVAMLYRARSADDDLPTAAVIAGSAIAGIFEDLLARDQVRHLGPVFTFYLLVASIALLSCYKYRELWDTAEEDLKIIQHAQQEMKKKWPSAIGSIRSFEKMYDVTVSSITEWREVPVQHHDSDKTALLKDVDKSCCRLLSAMKTTRYPWPGVMDLPAIPHSNFRVDSNGHDSGLQPPPNILELHAGVRRHNILSGDADWDPMISAEGNEDWPLDDQLFGGYLFWDDLPADVL